MAFFFLIRPHVGFFLVLVYLVFLLLEKCKALWIISGFSAL